MADLLPVRQLVRISLPVGGGGGGGVALARGRAQSHSIDMSNCYWEVFESSCLELFLLSPTLMALMMDARQL